MTAEDVKDYRVKITVRNNYLLTAMENAGIASLAELARRIKRTPTQLYGRAIRKLRNPRKVGRMLRTALGSLHTTGD